jgi:acyl-CoA thioester hydrolase
MGIVHHANYLIWFEAGRTEYFRRIGTGYHQIEGEGYSFPVSEAHARYAAPARYGKMVRVRTWVKEDRSREVTFAYSILSEETGAVLASGWTKHICVDRQGKVRRIPDFVRRAWSNPAFEAGSDDLP